MDIRPDMPQMDPLQRRKTAARGEQASPAGATGSDADQAAVRLDADTARRYVDQLRNHNPTDLHRLEDLKARIADGSYSASPEELADRLLEAIDRGAFD